MGDALASEREFDYTPLADKALAKAANCLIRAVDDYSLVFSSARKA